MITVQTLNFLLVEDDVEDKILLERILRKINGLKYTLTWCQTYEEGYHEIVNPDHDLIFLDYHLGAHDGVELLQAATEQGCHTPIIFLTGNPALEIYDQIKEKGATNYLRKGHFTPSHLAIAIDYAIEIAKQKARLHDLAIHDGLTDLYNHREFFFLLEKEITSARRHQRPLSLIMLDIDFFKKINDTFGHACGDRVLKDLAKTLTSTFRSADTCARYGGEEFAVILPEASGTDCQQRAERLRKRVATRSIKEEKTQIYFTISAGVAQLNHEDNPSSLVKRADHALYKAKNAGRNQVHYHE